MLVFGTLSVWFTVTTQHRLMAIYFKRSSSASVLLSVPRCELFLFRFLTDSCPFWQRFLKWWRRVWGFCWPRTEACICKPWDHLPTHTVVIWSLVFLPAKRQMCISGFLFSNRTALEPDQASLNQLHSHSSCLLIKHGQSNKSFHMFKHHVYTTLCCNKATPNLSNH